MLEIIGIFALCFFVVVWANHNCARNGNKRGVYSGNFYTTVKYYSDDIVYYTEDEVEEIRRAGEEVYCQNHPGVKEKIDSENRVHNLMCIAACVYLFSCIVLVAYKKRMSV